MTTQEAEAPAPLDPTEHGDAVLVAASAAEAGWPVLAIRAGTKAPLRPGGDNHERAWLRTGQEVTDAAQGVLTRHGWEAARSFAVITGIALGDGPALVALDVDGGADELAALLAEAGPEAQRWAEETVRVQRCPERAHLYGVLDAPAVPATTRLGRGLEWRGLGGYVLLPSSPHPSGSRYRITGGAVELTTGSMPDASLFDGIDTDGEGPLVRWRRVLPVPAALLAAVRRGTRPASVPPAASSSTRPAVTASKTEPSAPPEAGGTREAAYEAAVIDGITGDLQAAAKWKNGTVDEWERGWDGLTAAAAVRLTRLALADWSALTLAEAEALHFENCPRDAGWTDADVSKKWRAKQDYAHAQGPLPLTDNNVEEIEIVTAMTDEDSAAPRGDGSTEESEENPLELTPETMGEAWQPWSLADLVDPDRPERDWLWEGVLPMGEQGALIGPAGKGKSLLLQSLAVALAMGRPEFIGRPLNFSGRVLYVDMENSEDDWRERLLDMGVNAENAATVGERLILCGMPPLRGLDTSLGARQLMLMLHHHNVGPDDLLILDSTQRVTEGDENSNDTVRRLYAHTTGELKRRKITTWRLDNTGHDGDRARGASAKRDDVGYDWFLKEDAHDAEVFTMVAAKRRAKGDAKPFTFRRHEVDGLLTYTPTTGTPFSDVMAEAKELLEAAGVPADAGQELAYQTVKDHPKRPEGLTRKILRDAQAERRAGAAVSQAVRSYAAGVEK